MSRLVPFVSAALCVWAVGRSAAQAPDAVAERAQFLARARASSEAERRAVLLSIGADVPDAKGVFQSSRKTDDEDAPEADLDWLARLRELPAGTAGLSEAIADVEAIRALAATRAFDAARAILDFAFTDVGLVYRDECGRQLRAMSPYSLPALIVASKTETRGDKARYARYQLERLDRELPLKALHYAPDDEVKIAILAAYLEVRHREAVLAVLRTVDDVSPAVRAQARATWLGYVTGPPPPEAPKRKLQLPGGKQTDEEQSLFLNHRQLAEQELRRALEAQTGTAPAKRATLPDMTQALFDFYDQRRTAAREAAFGRGAEAAAAQRWADAAAAFDEVLTHEPAFARRAEMAPAYLAHGDALAHDKQWDAAAVAYAKAHAVAPTGPVANRALAGQYYAQGRALAAAGGDGAPLYRRALEHDPDHERAAAALSGDDPDAEPGGGAQPRWALYAGAVGGALGLVLLAVALARRRS